MMNMYPPSPHKTDWFCYSYVEATLFEIIKASWFNTACAMPASCVIHKHIRTYAVHNINTKGCLNENVIHSTSLSLADYHDFKSLEKPGGENVLPPTTECQKRTSRTAARPCNFMLPPVLSMHSSYGPDLPECRNV
ncbi:hypothetical protein D918_03158 [Trichuris suis]|nr:hypothetical protein D918_03158 [Trichuris suis]